MSIKQEAISNEDYPIEEVSNEDYPIEGTGIKWFSSERIDDKGGVEKIFMHYSKKNKILYISEYYQFAREIGLTMNDLEIMVRYFPRGITFRDLLPISNAVFSPLTYLSF